MPGLDKSNKNRHRICFQWTNLYGNDCKYKNDLKNAMTTDTSEFTINVQWNPDLFTGTSKGFMIFFYRDVTTYHNVPITLLFSVTQHHQKRWDPPNPMCDVIIEQLLYWSLFFNKVAGLRPARTSNTGVFLWILWNF